MPEKDEELLKLGEDETKPFNPSDYGYTVYEKWEYPQIIYKMDYDQPWINMGASYFESAKLLIKGVAKRTLNEDTEGIAGLFLFRHYLEVTLKKIVFWGRMLENPGKNAVYEEVRPVSRGHDLEKYWREMLRDAKPKIPAAEWDAIDIPLVEKCVMDFDSVDKNGFAFRYHGQGGERLRFDFEKLLGLMEHIRQVLDHVLTYLMETHGQNEEWEQIQASW
jgi:hypothetical protein